MSFEAIQQWFMGTIYGVLLLGTMGSVIGTGLIFLAKKVARKILAKRNDIILRLIFPLGLMVERGEALRNSVGSTTRDGRYLGYVIVVCCYSVFGIVASFCFLSLSAYIFINYYLDRPGLLSFFVALTLISIYGLLKDVVYLRCLVCDIVHGEYDRIKKEQPKNYSEWVKLRLGK